jgi:hypothetical protein
MTVEQAIETKKVTLDEIVDWMEGNQNRDFIQNQLNEITGFESTTVDVCEWDMDSILKEQLIEDDFVCLIN